MQKKTVFISWAGTQSKSYHLAELLKGWLPRVLKGVKPYVSFKDIDAGRPWLPEVFNALRKSTFTILCLSKENVQSPWIHFEAGVAARSLDGPSVCPLLIDVSPSKVRYPLSTFTSVPATKTGLWRLLTSLNSRLRPRMRENELKSAFEKGWPELSEDVGPLLRRQKKGFWKVLTEGMRPREPVRIVLSAKWTVEYVNGRPTQEHGHTIQVSYNEVNAFFGFQRVLHETGHSVELVHGGIRGSARGQAVLPASASAGTLVILGSIHANNMCKLILSDEHLQGIPFRYGTTKEREKCIWVCRDNDRRHNRRPITSYPLVPAREQRHGTRRKRALRVDYGIILRVTNPLNKAGTSKVLILGGNHGFGTESAIKFITNRMNCRTLDGIVGDNDFELLFEACVGQNCCGLPLGIKELRILKDGRWQPPDRK
jgi:hypothetical protein